MCPVGWGGKGERGRVWEEGYRESEGEKVRDSEGEKWRRGVDLKEIYMIHVLSFHAVRTHIKKQSITSRERKRGSNVCVRACNVCVRACNVCTVC